MPGIGAEVCGEAAPVGVVGQTGVFPSALDLNGIAEGVGLVGEILIEELLVCGQCDAVFVGLLAAPVVHDAHGGEADAPVVKGVAQCPVAVLVLAGDEFRVDDAVGVPFG